MSEQHPEARTRVTLRSWRRMGDRAARSGLLRGDRLEAMPLDHALARTEGACGISVRSAAPQVFELAGEAGWVWLAGNAATVVKECRGRYTTLRVRRPTAETLRSLSRLRFFRLIDVAQRAGGVVIRTNRWDPTTQSMSIARDAIS